MCNIKMQQYHSKSIIPIMLFNNHYVHESTFNLTGRHKSLETELRLLYSQDNIHTQIRTELSVFIASVIRSVSKKLVDTYQTV